MCAICSCVITSIVSNYFTFTEVVARIQEHDEVGIPKMLTMSYQRLTNTENISVFDESGDSKT